MVPSCLCHSYFHCHLTAINLKAFEVPHIFESSEVQANFLFRAPDPHPTGTGQPCANTFRFCEFEEVQLHYSLLSGTLGYDITTKKTKQNKKHLPATPQQTSQTILSLLGNLPGFACKISWSVCTKTT